MRQNEKDITGATDLEITQKFKNLINVMLDSVEHGLTAEGVLPGPIKLQRKAHKLYEKANNMHHSPDRFLILLNAYSLAASEENAAGHIVVTAPTSGSAGVLPGVIYLLKHHHQKLIKTLIDSMMVAGVIGLIARHNASISGAEVGCQGEIGVASAMGAALLSWSDGHMTTRRIENAAEIALEHHLGMTCDPIDGYVQIPCIERNAIGAVTSYNSYLIASIGEPNTQKIRFDEVVQTMLETGQDMHHKYKETSVGGLATCTTCC
jgi:L-serine dehydratase